MVTDTACNIIAINDNFSGLSGYVGSEIIGFAPSLLRVQGDCTSALPAIQDAVRKHTGKASCGVDTKMGGCSERS